MLSTGWMYLWHGTCNVGVYSRNLPDCAVLPAQKGNKHTAARPEPEADVDDYAVAIQDRPLPSLLCTCGTAMGPQLLKQRAHCMHQFACRHSRVIPVHCSTWQMRVLHSTGGCPPSGTPGCGGSVMRPSADCGLQCWNSVCGFRLSF